MSDPILRAEGLVLRYGATTILEETSFDIARGEIFVIAGASGSGGVRDPSALRAGSAM